ncbi:histidine--tRNA ligase [Terrarubrum flagellatum]|uniref:histidine--tRNA ligase n=1 Tax=Terrirubrum flagellatum TaxID=2895980 RepID=UPI003144FC39
MSKSEKNKPEKKSNKVAARAPRGFVDRDPGDLAATARMMDKIREVYERYGFEGVETPFVEYTDALGKFLPDQDRPNEGVFSFQDDDEQWLSLRYDLTAPLARYVAENFDRLPKPYRSYRAGWVFRNEKPGPGRFRQFMQFDADTVGASSVAADAEVCMMAADTMEALGVKRGDYVIKVNNRKILDGVMEAIGLGGEENAGRRLTVLRAIDKYDRLGSDGVMQLLGDGRKDESGDFTKGAGLSQVEAANIIRLIQAGLFLGGELPSAEFDPNDDNILSYSMFGETKRYRVLNSDKLRTLQTGALPQNETTQKGVAELVEIERICSAAGYGSRRIRIDTSVVRGLEYYTGPVFECELTFAVTGEDGKPVRFGSVGGGGRYDGLVSRFRNEPVPATGFSIGVSRLVAALQTIKSPIVTGANVNGPVVVVVMEKDQIGAYQKLVATLRDADIRAEMYLGDSNKLGPQFKYADRRNSPCVIIQGSNERDAGEVQIKDLIEGAKQADAFKSNAEYRAARLAQFSCKEDEMVAKVRELLNAHGIE